MHLNDKTEEPTTDTVERANRSWPPICTILLAAPQATPRASASRLLTHPVYTAIHYPSTTRSSPLPPQLNFIPLHQHHALPSASSPPFPHSSPSPLPLHLQRSPPRIPFPSLEKPSALARLHTTLQHRRVLLLIGIIKRALASAHLPRHRAIQRIEAVAADARQDPQARDAERGGAHGPEETAEGCGHEGAFSVALAGR